MARCLKALIPWSKFEEGMDEMLINDLRREAAASAAAAENEDSGYPLRSHSTAASSCISLEEEVETPATEFEPDMSEGLDNPAKPTIAQARQLPLHLQSRREHLVRGMANGSPEFLDS
jgi:hypothetical protein